MTTETLAHTEIDPTAKPSGDHDRHSRLVIRNDDGAVLGTVQSRRRDGWRFYPRYQRKPSRKGWPTPAQALKSYKIKLTPWHAE